MTLVNYFVNFLRPYADMPEFTTCVIKALEKLGHTITKESFYEVPACNLAGEEAHTLIIDELCDE
jgi:hypothetical protein